MSERPTLDKTIKAETFREFYWLKEELVDFCQQYGLPTSGGKIAITERIETYLKTGEIVLSRQKPTKKAMIENIHEDMEIEENIVCSQKHRIFFKEKIGKKFSFNVTFQDWLATNAGKTYAQAIIAYDEILEAKKKGTTTIAKQFEYNTYIRAFFADNQGKSLPEAIICWNYKKAQKGHNAYEKTDLVALCEVI